MENKTISKETMEELSIACDAIIKAMKAVAKVIIKAWDAIKKFMNEHPWIITLGLNNIKFKKRSANRNRLYVKRKKLGRKL